MSKENRKVFDLNEQKAKDVLSAIKAIVPVISLIREWGKVEQEYEQIEENNKRLSKEIDSIEYVRQISYSGGDLKKTLSKVLESKSSEYKVSSEKEGELELICEDMESEVVNYREYARMFSWINDDIFKKTTELSSFEDEEEFLAMLFLVLNSDAKIYEWNSFYKKQDSSRQLNMNHICANGWNYMLRKLKANEI